MLNDDILTNISSELVAAIIIFILGIIGSKVPISIEKYKMRRFFGKAFFTDNFKLVYGMLSTVANGEKSNEKVYLQKIYHNGRKIYVKTMKKVLTQELLKANSYLLYELSKYRKKPFLNCTDVEAFKNLNNTFVSIGGPAVNELTDWVLNENNNIFFKFNLPNSSQNIPWSIEIISDKSIKKNYQIEKGIDYGIIIKLKNDRFKQHYFFVCAGISTWGTSGACWYLSKYWKKLYKEFKTKEFGIIVKVNRISDHTSIREYP